MKRERNFSVEDLSTAELYEMWLSVRAEEREKDKIERQERRLEGGINEGAEKHWDDFAEYMEIRLGVELRITSPARVREGWQRFRAEEVTAGMADMCSFWYLLVKDRPDLVDPEEAKAFWQESLTRYEDLREGIYGTVAYRFEFPEDEFGKELVRNLAGRAEEYLRVNNYKGLGLDRDGSLDELGDLAVMQFKVDGKADLDKWLLTMLSLLPISGWQTYYLLRHLNDTETLSTGEKREWLLGMERQLLARREEMGEEEWQEWSDSDHVVEVMIRIHLNLADFEDGLRLWGFLKRDLAMEQSVGALVDYALKNGLDLEQVRSLYRRYTSITGEADADSRRPRRKRAQRRRQSDSYDSWNFMWFLAAKHLLREGVFAYNQPEVLRIMRSSVVEGFIIEPLEACLKFPNEAAACGLDKLVEEKLREIANNVSWQKVEGNELSRSLETLLEVREMQARYAKHQV